MTGRRYVSNNGGRRGCAKRSRLDYTRQFFSPAEQGDRLIVSDATAARIHGSAAAATAARQWRDCERVAGSVRYGAVRCGGRGLISRRAYGNLLFGTSPSPSPSLYGVVVSFGEAGAARRGAGQTEPFLLVGGSRRSSKCRLETSAKMSTSESRPRRVVRRSDWPPTGVGKACVDSGTPHLRIRVSHRIRIPRTTRTTRTMRDDMRCR